MEKLGPEMTLSPGYYDRCLYLFWLRNIMEAGISFASLSADEAEGLCAIQGARAEFESNHPLCPTCGNRLSFRGQKRCFGCHRELN